MKVFIYCYKEYPINAENVFISGAYKNVKDFIKQNPDCLPLCAYDAATLVEVIQSKLKPVTKKKKGEI